MIDLAEIFPWYYIAATLVGSFVIFTYVLEPLLNKCVTTLLKFIIVVCIILSIYNLCAGIPAREVGGWAYDGIGKFMPHAWVEVAIKANNNFYWLPDSGRKVVLFHPNRQLVGTISVEVRVKRNLKRAIPHVSHRLLLLPDLVPVEKDIHQPIHCPKINCESFPLTLIGAQGKVSPVPCRPMILQPRFL